MNVCVYCLYLLTITEFYFVFRSFLTWTDFFSLVAQWIISGLFSADVHYWDSEGLWRLFEACSVIRVVRVFRIFRLAKHYTGLQILVLALRESARELAFLGMFVAIGMLIFATFIFYAEFKTEGIFLSIPESFWWAIITMTTVGYGDAAPMTGWGYFVGALCALCGIVTIGLHIPIIATNFKVFYDYVNLTQRMKGKETLDLENISISKLKGTLFKFKKDKNDKNDRNNKGNNKRPASRGSLASNSSKKSIGSKHSKIHPLNDASEASTSNISPEYKSENKNITFGVAPKLSENHSSTNISLGRSGSEERNDLISTSDNTADDKLHLIRPKTRGKYPKSKSELNSTGPNDNSSKPDSYPLLTMNNLNNSDLDNTNGNSPEKTINKEPDSLVLDAPNDSNDNDNNFSELPEKKEILFDPGTLRTTSNSPPQRQTRPTKPPPPPRTSSLNTLSPTTNPSQNDSHKNNDFAPPGHLWNPPRVSGLPRIEDDGVEQTLSASASLPPIQITRPATCKGTRPKKKKEKRRRGFMML